ncbi:hypothetical protein AB0Q95_35000 [Streptomyces sp. NPDC059900]|uniref:hypothetical protein n=1 Tax=Streptomyces sp. NPDC059900 TaxID=3155816 RepID=UPI0034286A08
MLLQQAAAGGTVMILTAFGPTENGVGYRCVFEVELRAVESGAVVTGGSRVTSANPPSSCRPGEPSTLNPAGKDRLRRTGSDDRATTYDRSQ